MNKPKLNKCHVINTALEEEDLFLKRELKTRIDYLIEVVLSYDSKVMTKKEVKAYINCIDVIRNSFKEILEE